jgi:PAS domain S-box-containing protein
LKKWGAVTTEHKPSEKSIGNVVRTMTRRIGDALRPRRRDTHMPNAEDKWRSMLENPVFGISFIDEHQRFIATNKAYQAMVGYTDEELRRMTPLDISVPGEREINQMLFMEMQAGRRRHYEMVKQLRRKNGELIWVQLYVFAIPDRASHSQLAFGMLFDITEKKQAEDALQEMRGELARVARLTRMDAITASIAHEINQPIGAVVANANAGLRWLSRETPDLGETRAALQRVVRDGHQAAELIKQIRAKFKTGGQNRVPVDLNELIREVVALAQTELQKRPIVVHLDLADELPPVTADRVQLQQVISSLITNAVDAMDMVTDRSRIIRVESNFNDRNEVLVAVADAGTGVEPELVDRIFDTFFTTKPHGMGMGLSISRSIIEAHEGRLWVEPGVCNGAVFRLSLPAHDAVGELLD